MSLLSLEGFMMLQFINLVNKKVSKKKSKPQPFPQITTKSFHMMFGVKIGSKASLSRNLVLLRFIILINLYHQLLYNVCFGYDKQLIFKLRVVVTRE